eukprot:CAMPEP_0194319076 /NCGR_PEP_ID=MMETSP0171-20130528/15592_1 /TAXON_ID=218684 /ORGANISM="Corethron pennatum, Strain L29A3" /LENGTH=144 /DNA_ID=CAMNT_0039076177 /DNA_START=119 /DNA_END=553 /DNA_ORIENTATION=+
MKAGAPLLLLALQLLIPAGFAFSIPRRHRPPSLSSDEKPAAAPFSDNERIVVGEDQRHDSKFRRKTSAITSAASLTLLSFAPAAWAAAADAATVQEGDDSLLSIAGILVAFSGYAFVMKEGGKPDDEDLVEEKKNDDVTTTDRE